MSVITYIPLHRLPWRTRERPSRWPWIQRRRRTCLRRNVSDCEWRNQFRRTGRRPTESSQLPACNHNTAMSAVTYNDCRQHVISTPHTVCHCSWTIHCLSWQIVVSYSDGTNCLQDTITFTLNTGTARFNDKQYIA